MKKKKMPLAEDLAFKYVFSKKEILEDFISSFFNYMGMDDKINIKDIIPEAYIMPNGKDYKEFYGDLLIKIDNVVILLEMYKDKFNFSKLLKSCGYICRLIGNQLVKTKPENFKTVVGINLMQGDYGKMNKEVVNEYVVSNRISNANLFKEYVPLYLVRYDKVKEIEEQENEHRFIKYLRIIWSESVEEMKKHAKGDKMMLEAIELLNDWHKSSVKENYEMHCEELIDEGKTQGIKIGLDRGKTQGIKIGLNRGRKTNQLEIAKKLIVQNAGKEYIMDLTGISEKEYEKLQNDKNNVKM